MRIAVVTPTIGRRELSEAINSVLNQMIPDGVTLTHYIVFDGPCRALYDGIIPEKVVCIELPFNTGGKGFYGHKIMGAMCSLLEEEWICFLDDDNTWSPNHIKTMVEAARGKDWVFSFRNLMVNRKVVQKDDFESLGPYRRSYVDEYKYLIDTNCYLIKREIAMSSYRTWCTGFGADRVLADHLMRHFPNYSCTFQYTVNYEINPEIIARNCQHRYPLGGKPPVFIFHMTPEATRKSIVVWKDYLFAREKCDEDEEVLYDPHLGQKQWQINFYLGSPFDISDGFEAFRHAPSGSTFLFVSYDFKRFPLEALKRKDVNKILYTVESPNRFYTHNWTKENLSYFNTVITYWKDFTNDSFHPNNPKVIYHPFVNKLNLFSDCELSGVTPYTNPRENSVACVLQNREGKGSYKIDSAALEILDYLRLEMMQKLSKIMPVKCYGASWTKSALPYALTRDRFLDDERVTSLYAKHRFVYISENTDARGYFSEKIHDALIAGCIPIYVCTEKNYEEAEREFGSVAIILRPDEDLEVFSKKIKNFTPNPLDRENILRKYSIDKLMMKIDQLLTQALH